MSLFSFALQVHQALYERTDGRIGHRLLGVPTLLLRTTGARSGRERTSALVYVKDGERYVVVASKGGSDQAPGWLHNLRHDASPQVQIGRQRHRASAETLGGADPDYPRLWKLVNDHNAGRYDAYQRRTDRQIPLVALRLED